LFYYFYRPDLYDSAASDLPDANAANAGSQLQVANHVPCLRRNYRPIGSKLPALRKAAARCMKFL
jgi:hypothetical protein